MSKEREEDFFDDEVQMVTITLDDGSELECIVLSIFEVGDNEYIAIMPDDEEAEDVYFYRYRELEDGQPELVNIESDDEYEMVVDAFDEILDEEEFMEYEDELE